MREIPVPARQAGRRQLFDQRDGLSARTPARLTTPGHPSMTCPLEATIAACRISNGRNAASVVATRGTAIAVLSASARVKAKTCCSTPSLKQAGRPGVGTFEDLNGFQPEGSARYDSTKWKRNRSSAAVAYVHPLKGRKNLVFSPGQWLSRCTSRRQSCFRCRFLSEWKAPVGGRWGKEVILCGGAINSPQILELSGVGERE